MSAQTITEPTTVAAMSDQPEPTACPECDGWGNLLGHDPRGLNLGPLHPCERCWGTGVIDCTCPGACRMHNWRPMVGAGRVA